MYLCNQLLGVELMLNQIHEAKLKQIIAATMKDHHPDDRP